MIRHFTPATILRGVAVMLTFSLTMIGTTTVLRAASNNHSDLAKSKGIHAYSIAYFENGSVTFENYGKGIDENSVFEAGSNGKTVCAYIADKLVLEGKIGLDDPVYPYLDSDLITKDERIKEITLRQLLSHTAGFSPSYELGVDKKLYSDPGAEFRYSGVGYIYLQNVIENVTGLSFEEAAKQYVFAPLGMEHSTFEQAKVVTPYIRLSSATLYTFAMFLLALIVIFPVTAIVGKLTKFKYYSLKAAVVIAFAAAAVINIIFLLFVLISKLVLFFTIFLLAAGLLLWFTRKKPFLFYAALPVLILVVLLEGFLIPGSLPVTGDLMPRKACSAYSLKSTSSDMALFCEELMKDNKIDSYQMFPEVVRIDETNSWSLGIAMEKEAGDKITLWHSGINPGFQSLYVLVPTEERFIVVLTNSDDGLAFSQEIARDFLGIDGVWEIKR